MTLGEDAFTRAGEDPEKTDSHARGKKFKPTHRLVVGQFVIGKRAFAQRHESARPDPSLRKRSLFDMTPQQLDASLEISS